MGVPLPLEVLSTSGGSEIRLVRYRPGERHLRHAHARSSVTLVLRGAIEERVGSTDECGTPLSVVVKPAGGEHADTFGPGGAATLQLILSPEDQSLTAEAGPWAGGWRWCHANELARAMLRLGQVLLRTGGDAARKRCPPDLAALDDLVCETLAAINSPAADAGGVPPTWLVRVREALAADSTSIRILAAGERVHPVVLARLFRRSFGMTPTAYRRRARARRAASLIANTRGSLCDIPAAVIAETQRLHAVQDDAGTYFHLHGWGLGWDLGTYEKDTLIHRGGSFPGYRSHVSYMPERGIGVVVLANGGAAADLADLVAAGLDDHLLGRSDAESRLRERTARLDALRQKALAAISADRAKRAARSQVLPRPQEEYAGRYVSPTLGTLELLLLADGRLEAVMGVARSSAEVYDAEKNQLRVELFGRGSVLAVDFPAAGQAASAVQLMNTTFTRTRN